jgi:hypothetical protein
MIDPSTVQFLVQGGSVSVALACLYIVYKLVSNHDAHLLEALNRNTDAWIKNTEALTRLTGEIHDQGEDRRSA